ncbi:hypothetical protein Aglo03_60970 [Actinokineospora globicatena]|uniref:Uncharacterized protein n=1 Tax=Actinokineospora globicatena TaxID=103729 RepID=A0A9W6QQX5_9PSEU|nr:hypothetical protein Aglo03_60970 [Actinokineospora globicatena]
MLFDALPLSLADATAKTPGWRSLTIPEITDLRTAANLLRAAEHITALYPYAPRTRSLRPGCGCRSRCRFPLYGNGEA